MYEISFALRSQLVLRKTIHVNFPPFPPATFEESKMVNFQDKNVVWTAVEDPGEGPRGLPPPPPRPYF